jgi:bacteriocin biosynthesis cyclodehydratase domain-containing protein
VDLDSGGAASNGRRLPLLAPWWRVVDDGERILFEHAGRVVELRGRAVQALLPALLPLLDGAHSHADIIGCLGEAAEPSVRRALDLLDGHGLLTDGPRVEGDAAADYVATACPTVPPSSARAALADSRVAVHGRSVTAVELARLLDTSGVSVAKASAEPELEPGVDLLVSAPTPGEVEALHAANAERLRDGIPWLVVLPYDGRLTTVGPLYVPGQTACHACFTVRRAATSGYEEDFALLETRPAPAPVPDAVAVMAAGLASLVSLRWLAAKDPTLPGVAYALEASGVPTLTRHRVLRVPRCTVCGPTGPPPNPWFKELAAGDARRPVHAGR